MPSTIEIPPEGVAPLTDQFGRNHTYLRISLTDRCNLRCFYCMPANGITWTPGSHLMSADEVVKIASEFVDLGVNKIRLTGGEPLVRKDAVSIIKNLGKLPAELAISSNGVLVDRFINTFHEAGVKAVNISLDSLDAAKLAKITRRDHSEKIMENIQLLLREGFKVKLNAVVMRGMNENEVVDFVSLTDRFPLDVRFIEFMPFGGNKWESEKGVPFEESMILIRGTFGSRNIVSLNGSKNDTARMYQLEGAPGSFGGITTVSNPFCGGCNRLRLTADGKMKNCLFSNQEANLLAALRNGGDLEELIRANVWHKKEVRAGMTTPAELADPALHGANRSMVAIGG